MNIFEMKSRKSKGFNGFYLNDMRNNWNFKSQFSEIEKLSNGILPGICASNRPIGIN